MARREAFERTGTSISPQQTGAMVRNVVGAYGSASPQERSLGASFYPHWNEDAHYLADQLGHSDHAHASAMIARMSPQTEADVNRMMGYQMLHTTDKQAHHIALSATYAQEARKHPQGSEERAKLEGAAKQHRNLAGINGTPMGMQSSQSLSKALEHRNATHADPLSTLGDVKINDFAHAINDPAHERQTIDTHYHDAMHGRTDIPYDYNRGLGAKGRYEAHQRVAGLAYNRAGEKGLLDPDKTTPNGFMGGVWYHQQQAKADANPNSNKARRASDSRIRNFLNSPRAAEFDPAKHGQRPVGNQINV